MVEIRQALAAPIRTARAPSARLKSSGAGLVYTTGTANTSPALCTKPAVAMTGAAPSSTLTLRNSLATLAAGISLAVLSRKAID